MSRGSGCCSCLPERHVNPPRTTPLFTKQWFRKMFCKGQLKGSDFVAAEDRGPPPPGMGRVARAICWNRPPLFGLFAPWAVVVVVWLIAMAAGDFWWVFANPEGEPNEAGYISTITMVFGSVIAGATSEGGGSIAFPVFTLIVGLAPNIARDFSLAIQSVGMTCAAFTIWYNHIKVCAPALLWGTIGGFFGVLTGLAWVAPNLPPAYSKMIFVSIWFAFALNLFILNCERKRKVALEIVTHGFGTYATLSFTGFIGGLLTAISGSGIDICMFSTLTLVYRLSEKVATPTTVVLMAGNTVIGFFYQATRNVIDPLSYIFFAAAVPVVPLGAPVGALISSFLHRQVLAVFVYVTDTGQFILACVIIKMGVDLIVTTVVTTVGSLILFFSLRLFGGCYLRRIEEENAALIEGEEEGEPKILVEKWETSAVELMESDF